MLYNWSFACSDPFKKYLVPCLPNCPNWCIQIMCLVIFNFLPFKICPKLVSRVLTPCAAKSGRSSHRKMDSHTFCEMMHSHSRWLIVSSYLKHNTQQVSWSRPTIPFFASKSPVGNLLMRVIHANTTAFVGTSHLHTLERFSTTSCQCNYLYLHIHQPASSNKI